MTSPVPKNNELPIVLKQLWVVVMPHGAAYEAGVSYHLTEADRDRMIAEVAERLSTDMAGEREEPIGEPEPIHTTPDYYERIKSTPCGLRVR